MWVNAGQFGGILRQLHGFPSERSTVRQRFARSAWLLIGVCALAAMFAARPAAAQFSGRSPTTPAIFSKATGSRAATATARYAERVYDHVVNGVGQFEVHMGPRREFAIFKGVQDAHREHDSPDNLLKPFRVTFENGRAKQRWEIPSLNLAFTVDDGRRLADRLRELVHPPRAARQNFTLISSSRRCDPAAARLSHRPSILRSMANRTA